MTITTTIRLRRGLPRVPQGEPWPPVAADDISPVATAPVTPPPATPSPAFPEIPSDEAAVAPTPEIIARPVTPSPHAGAPLRQGLPRVPGGPSWPPETTVPTSPGVVAGASAVAISATGAAPAEPVPVGPAQPQPGDTPAAVAAPAATGATEIMTLRQGLPRHPGQTAWPPVTEVAVAQANAGPGEEQPSSPAPESTSLSTTEPPLVDPVTPVDNSPATDAPTPAPQPVPAEAKRYGRFTLAQWIGGGVLGLLGIIAVAGALVLGVRWFLTTGAGSDFTAAYPGEAPMPDSAPVGFPAWLAWSHFFNVFLMVLIIRSGLQIRGERRPPAYWSPRGNSGRKISLTIWFHQALDLLWVINGAVFAVLLFATGQWMRIVPTSWEVFPNAVSAGLQYLSLDWPTENGWVHYNGLQQLAYFLTVFIAAPLAVATGVRMSGLWSNKWEKLSALYPVELARKVHFPVMIYFVFFIVTHVLLVLATGALRNLNHMFAAQGSTDPAAYADNWTGFWLLVLSLVVIAAAWVAARPMLLAPVARIFGKVTNR